MSGRYHSYISNQLSYGMDFSQMPVRLLISHIPPCNTEARSSTSYALNEIASLTKLFSQSRGGRSIQLIQPDYLHQIRQQHSDLVSNNSETIHFLHISGTELTRSDEIDEWVEVIGAIPGLQMVFLNGCATLEMVEKLMLKDIPLIIATNKKESTTELTQIAQQFYTLLLQGFSLLEAFERMDDSPINESQIACAYYDLELDALQWERPIYLQESKPHLFLLADHVDVLQTSIPSPLGSNTIYSTYEGEELLAYEESIMDSFMEEVESVTNNYAETPSHSTVDPKIKENIISNWKMLIFTCILFLGGICCFSYYLYRPDIDGLCVFNSEEQTYNILILPFADKANCDITNTPFTQTVWGFFSDFSNQKLNVQLQPKVNCLLRADQAMNQMNTCHIDLLVWGNYSNIGQDSAQLDMYYITKNRSKTKIGTGRIATKIGYKDHLPELPQEIRQTLWLLIGQGLNNKSYHELAIKTLNYIPQTKEEAYIPTAISLAEAFTAIGDFPNALYYYNLILEIHPDHKEALHKKCILSAQTGQLDSAAIHFDHLISTYPNFSGAYYNRSLLHLKNGRINKARADIEKAIRLSPADGNAYGILASIYAQEKETDLFYHNFEVALKTGLDLEQFLAYTPLAEYRDEERFQLLMNNYP